MTDQVQNNSFSGSTPETERASSPAAGKLEKRPTAKKPHWGNTTGTTYSISDLAHEFDITPRAIRYYEDKGLLQPIREGSKRIYRRRDRTRLKLIMRAKRLGISLDEARELFELYDQMYGEARQLNRFLAILAERRASLEQQRQDIDETLEEIDSIEAECYRLLERESGADQT